MDHGHDDDKEALRLIKAFYGIGDREARRIIVAIVEAAARGDAIKIDDPVELGIAIRDWSSTGENTPH